MLLAASIELPGGLWNGIETQHRMIHRYSSIHRRPSRTSTPADKQAQLRTFQGNQHMTNNVILEARLSRYQRTQQQ